MTSFYDSQILIQFLKYFFQVLETGFRGRPLNGLKITLPLQMTGLVIDTETKEKTSSKMLKNVFREIHSWQLDEPEISDKTEPFAKALKWFDIAKIVRISNVKIVIINNSRKIIIFTNRFTQTKAKDCNLFN